MHTFWRPLLEGCALAVVWLIASISSALLLPPPLPPLDPAILEREKEVIRSWKDVEKTHQAQMEMLKKEGQNSRLPLRQLSIQAVQNFPLSAFAILLLGFALRAGRRPLVQGLLLAPSLILAGVYLKDLALVTYIALLPLAGYLLTRNNRP